MFFFQGWGGCNVAGFSVWGQRFEGRNFCGIGSLVVLFFYLCLMILL